MGLILPAKSGASAGAKDRSEDKQFDAKDKVHGNAIPDEKNNQSRLGVGLGKTRDDRGLIEIRSACRSATCRSAVREQMWKVADRC
jgi:hypothetical protein